MNPRIEICSSCGLSFVDLAALREHERHVHDDDELIVELRAHIDGLEFALKASETERNAARARLATIRAIVQIIVVAGYVDEHAREWERGEGVVAKLIAVTGDAP